MFARKEQRDFSSALRYTLRIGLLAIENPELTIQEIKDIIEAIELLKKLGVEDYCLMSRNAWVYYIDKDQKFIDSKSK